MKLSDRNKIIRTAIAKHTAANTATSVAARNVLTAEGIYTRGGKLTANYGGAASRSTKSKAKK